MTFILTIILILLWFIFTGIREAMLWNHKDSFLGIDATTYSFMLVPITFLIPISFLAVIGYPWYAFLFAILSLELTMIRFRVAKSGIYWYKWKWLDYHTLRSLEGLFLFIPCWIIMKDFFLLSAVWLVGNWIYKRIMNKVMYNEWYKISNMKIYWMLGYPLPYSDYIYDFSLVLPLIYFIGIIL